MKNSANKNAIVDDNFFFIDSDNVAQVQSKLYGFAVTRDIENVPETMKNNMNFIETYTNGSYILVQKTDDEIYINQDFNGNYGLYYFKKDNYFALSNSFVYLVEKLKDSQILSLNYDYANAFLVGGLSPISDADTMVNEIEVLPRNLQIIIGISSGKVEFRHIDYKEHTVNLNSKEGIEIIDRWFYRWTHLIREMEAQNKKISVDLSGGMDSRLVFMLFLKAGVKWDNIRINSSNDALHCHGEDFEIASEISNYFGVELNKKVFERIQIPLRLEESINLSFYTEGCVRKQMHWKQDIDETPFFYFKGSGGEFLRALWYIEPEEYIKKECQRGRRYPKADVSKSVENILRNSYQKAKEKYRQVKQNGELTQLMYRDTRCRHHFGKEVVLHNCANVIVFAPLMDSELAKLYNDYKDANLLIALMFSRYCPDLLQFKIEGNRKIEKSTIEYAMKINEKYPLNPVVHEKFKEGPYWIIGKKFMPTDRVERLSYSKMDDFIYDVFNTDKCKKLMSAYFHEDVYNYAKEYKVEHDYFPLWEVYGVVATYIILNYVLESQRNLEKKSTFDEILSLYSEEQINPCLICKDEVLHYRFPYELVPQGKRIILYGAGNVGKEFYGQVIKSEYCKVEAWVDKRYKNLQNIVESPEVITGRRYDKVVIAARYEDDVLEIKEELMRQGVDKEKIVWKNPSDVL